MLLPWLLGGSRRGEVAVRPPVTSWDRQEVVQALVWPIRHHHYRTLLRRHRHLYREASLELFRRTMPTWVGEGADAVDASIRISLVGEGVAAEVLEEEDASLTLSFITINNNNNSHLLNRTLHKLARVVGVAHM